MDLPDLLTPAEAAAVLGVNIWTLRAWARQGALNTVRTPGGHRRYRREQIDAVVAARAARVPRKEGNP